jgi:hypothetical protein
VRHCDEIRTNTEETDVVKLCTRSRDLEFVVVLQLKFNERIESSFYIFNKIQQKPDGADWH